MAPGRDSSGSPLILLCHGVLIRLEGEGLAYAQVTVAIDQKPARWSRALILQTLFRAPPFHGLGI